MRKRYRPQLPKWFTKEDAKFFRDYFSEQEFRAFQQQKEGLIEESKSAGIPLEDIKHYWYKSKQYSIFAKTKEIDLKKSIDELVEVLKDVAPAKKKYKRKKFKKPVLFCISPSDIHFGKLATQEETGNVYDLDVAAQRFVEGVKGLIEYINCYQIEKIVVVGGNDILHTDTLLNTTTKGTPQDVSGKFYESFTKAFETYTLVLDVLMDIADVYYVHCMSNHDYLSGYYFSKCLEAYYSKNENISFNTSSSPRKYIHYGLNLLGFSHGDTAKDSQLPNIMKTEAKQSWSKCLYGYWYLGHFHHHIRKQDNKIISKDYDDVTIIKGSEKLIENKIKVEFLRSISGTDAWHNQKGYKAKPALEGFLHSPTEGQIARFTKYVK